MSYGKENLKSVVDSAVDNAESWVSESSRKMNNTVNEKAADAAEVTREFVDQAENTYQKAKSKGEDLLKSGIKMAEDFANTGKEKAAFYGQQTQDYVQKNPLKSVAIAAGVGALAAGLLAMNSSSRKQKRSY